MPNLQSHWSDADLTGGSQRYFEEIDGLGHPYQLRLPSEARSVMCGQLLSLRASHC
jgi:hypothetical protein